ncbi:M56 family metallopeptidase [uncultured Planktosalinus sp.]|uniref:M56 family metallopeptidase n=1 Tax=uncultured Planktosalinus sp. TaxID=1810935 RepID=UPI0030D8958F
MLFLIVYELLLKKETFFQWNRFYLCLTPLLALIFPFIKIPALQTIIPQNFAVVLPEIILGPTSVTAQNNLATKAFETSVFEIILLSGIILSTVLFFWKLNKIFQLKRKGKTEILEGTTLVRLPDSTDAFSFGNLIFIGEKLEQNARKHIINHELVHIKQKHYVDLIYFELLRIVFWFNPLIYLFQNRVATLHEYIADSRAVAATDKKTYYQNLLTEVFKTQHISFINTFFNHSLIKKRIVMLQKSKSKKTQLAKFLMLVPLLAGIILYTSCSQDVASESSHENSITQKIEELKIALENNSGGISLQEHEELVKLARQTALKGYDQNNALNLFESGELDVLPFAVIDQAPIYPGCENLSTNEERKQCMSENLNTLIIENFNSKVAKGLGLNGRVKLSVQFKIDEQGNVVDILSRAPIAALEEEARRVVGLIPQMQPGKQDGKAVAVSYALPIVFEVNE